MQFRPERCVVVVVATAILHNICIQRRLPLPNDDERVGADDNNEGNDSDSDEDDDNDRRQMNRNDGIITRDDVIRMFFQ